MDVPYTLPADGVDVFRTFVLPIPSTSARYVKAMEFHPGNARAVHHANIGIDRTKSSRRLDAADAEPGYVGGMVPDADYPAGYMLGWTPGQHPRPSPEGMAWRLEPGSDLVVQLHLQPTGKPETVQVSIGFFFTDDAADTNAGRVAARKRNHRHRQRAMRTMKSKIATCCRSTSKCSPSSRTRTISDGSWKRPRCCPTAPLAR